MVERLDLRTQVSSAAFEPNTQGLNRLHLTVRTGASNMWRAAQAPSEQGEQGPAPSGDPNIPALPEPAPLTARSRRSGDLLLRALFFFSSRRRHTSLQGDWSSDVCSSDLPRRRAGLRRPDAEVLSLDICQHVDARPFRAQADAGVLLHHRRRPVVAGGAPGRASSRLQLRSEERRVGKDKAVRRTGVPTTGE